MNFDEFFYSNLLQSINKNLSFKIKQIGNKNDVLNKLVDINENKIDSAFVIIDRDYEGLTCTIPFQNRIIRTYGYSWENDFWTEELCYDVINQMSPLKSAGDNFKEKIKRSKYRAAKIGLLDAAGQTAGFPFIPKNKKTYGFSIHPKNSFPISKQEVIRILKLAKEKNFLSCPIFKSVITEGKKSPSERLIQGHAWEYIVTVIISHHYKINTGAKSCPNDIIKNTAMSLWKTNPSRYLSQACITHFQKELFTATS
ncbi:DUF4435 domain-containing protein [Vogesella indigofera]|uniref:DUF4435 domain-containing protein n=1 Tax=Vogesella indigofera TaxID=45465 RepID=UPI0035B0555E